MTIPNKHVYRPVVWNFVPTGPVVLTKILTRGESIRWHLPDDPLRHQFRAEIVAGLLDRADQYAVDNFQIRDSNRVLLNVEIAPEPELRRSVDE